MMIIVVCQPKWRGELVQCWWRDEAQTVEELNLPTFQLHSLKGDLLGLWSITVRANWRIVFRFEPGRAFDVDFVDYH